MKILAFTFSAGLKGGANRSFLMVLEYLKNTYKHEIHVITPNEGPLCNELKKKGISCEIQHYPPVGFINGFSLINVLKYIKHTCAYLKCRKSAYIFLKHINKEDYDIVYLNDIFTYFGAIVAQKLGLPYVWHFRSHFNKKAKFVFGTKKLLDHCQRIIAISRAMKNSYLENNVMRNSNILVVTNGIPVENCRRSKLKREHGFHIIQCGRIAQDKCQKDAIQAMAILIKNVSNIYLHIVGEASGVAAKKYHEGLKKLIDKLNLAKNVIFEGQLEDVASFREQMHCEIICSKSEPFGRVTVEGMRSGLVVIGANTGGTVEIIEDGVTGLLYRQGDVEDLASKINLIYQNEDIAETLSTQAFNFSKSHFLPENTVDSVNEILKNSLRYSIK